MPSKSSTLTKAGTVVMVHGVGEHNKAEAVVVETAESYTPTTSADWTALGVTAPTTQDEALDSLAEVVADANVAAAGLVWKQATYDFSVHGGAISTINLGVSIPDDAYVTYAFIRVDTAPTSAGGTGTIKFVLPTDGDLTTTVTADGSASGAINGIPDWDAANFVDTTAARNISVTIATTALTAGKLTLFVAYAVTPA